MSVYEGPHQFLYCIEGSCVTISTPLNLSNNSFMPSHVNPIVYFVYTL